MRSENEECTERAKREKEEREKKEIEGKIAEAYISGWPPEENTPKSGAVIRDDPMGYGDGVSVDGSGM